MGTLARPERLQVYIIMLPNVAPTDNRPCQQADGRDSTVQYYTILYCTVLYCTVVRITSGSCYLVAAYKYTDLLLDSLQGFVVALTFCYRNGEVSQDTHTHTYTYTHTHGNG